MKNTGFVKYNNHKKYKVYINQLYSELINSSQFINQTHNGIEMDVVLEGGGFSGAYEVGVMLFLKKLEANGHISINRISGVSVGSIVGLLYLTNKLHYYDKYYSKIREDWYTNLEMNSLGEFIKKIIDTTPDEVFENIKNDRLFISYYNLKSKQHITKSRYVNKSDLYETIMKSTHMPLLKSKDVTYKDSSNTQFIDGLYPYLFENIKQTRASHNETKRTHKIIYVSINQIHKLHSCVDTRNETDCFSRILHGILYCYDLFKYNKKNEYCSFLDEWNLIDVSYYRFKQLLLFVFMYCIYFTNSVFVSLKPYIERIPLLSSIMKISRCYIDDILRIYFT